MSVASLGIDKRRKANTVGLFTPLSLLLLVMVAVCILLAVPLRVPVGPMYWDVMIYYDAANRIFDGQAPVLDFFTPVGPLGYYLFAGWLALFPDANPTLIAHWSLLALTAPLMALVVLHVDRRSRTTAFALLVPFLIFALLPFNTREFYPYPGSDGFGIYNRQVCQVLYVLAAAFLFVRDRRLLAFVVFATVTALFFLKITGFVAALPICVFGLLAGRIGLRHTVAAGLGFAAVLGLLQLSNGLISAYVADILALVDKNSESLAPRFLQSASLNFGVIAPAGALVAVLLYAQRASIAGLAGDLRGAHPFAAAAKLLDRDALWLGVLLLAGIVFETQNTGSQAMIFIWPALLAILLRSVSLMARPGIMISVMVLAAAAYLPVVVNTAEKAARTYVGAAKNVALEHRNLKALGLLNMRDDVLDIANTTIGFYAEHEPVYEEMVARGKLPSPLLYSNFDFQIVHLMAIDRAVDSIRALETKNGVRFETLLNMNFVNPFPYLMDRGAPKHVAIGADPMRAVPDPGPQVVEAVGNVDLALLPRCPPTTANADLLALYAPMLKDHRRIELDRCFDAYVHPRFRAIEPGG